MWTMLHLDSVDQRPVCAQGPWSPTGATSGPGRVSPPLLPGKDGCMPRLRSLWLSLSDISRRIEQSEALQLAADFDGTLIPIAEHPDQAGVPERTRAVLHRLAALPDLDLAVLSGRRLDDLEHHFNGGRIFLAGAGGLESRDEVGQRKVHLPADARLPE